MGPLGFDLVCWNLIVIFAFALVSLDLIWHVTVWMGLLGFDYIC